MQALVKRDYGKKIGAKMIVLTEQAKQELKDIAEYYKKLSKDQAYVNNLGPNQKKDLTNNIKALEDLYDYYETKNTLRAGDMNTFTQEVKEHLDAKKTWTDSYLNFVGEQNKKSEEERTARENAAREALINVQEEELKREKEYRQRSGPQILLDLIRGKGSSPAAAGPGPGAPYL
jgi:hypothetical protein